MEQPGEITPTAVELAEQAGIIASESWPEITNNAEYEQAASARKQAKVKLKELTNERLSITRPMDESKKKVMSFFKAPIDALTQFVASVDVPMIAYTKKQEAARIAEENRLRLEAEELAKKEAEEALELAGEMEAAGDKDLADEIRTQATTAEVVVAQPTIQKANDPSTSSQTVKRHECTDKMALIKAVAAGDAPERLLDVNSAMLGRYCEATGKAPDGCRMWEDTIIVSR